MKFYKKKVITRGDNQPYLVRYSIFSCRWFAVKIHHILISDDDCSHDHPWSFISIILKGAYTEVLRRKIVRKYKTLRIPTKGTFIRDVAKHYRSGSILYRPKNSIHKLIIEPGKTAWTLVITFKKVQDWGFYTPRGFVNWRQYHSTGERCE